MLNFVMAAHHVELKDVTGQRFKDEPCFETGAAFEERFLQLAHSNAGVQVRLAKGRGGLVDGSPHSFTSGFWQLSQLAQQAAMKTNP